MAPNPTEKSTTGQEPQAPSAAANPPWMTTEYFMDIVAQDFKNFTITDLEVALSSGKGENFAAVLHRVKAVIKNEDDGTIARLPCIVKSLPTGGGLSDEMLKQFNIFPKEMAVYEEILDKFAEVYRSIGEEIEFGPRCYKISKLPNPTDIIVMEDMLVRDYKMGVRQKGLDMDHMKIILRKMAKYHAASVVVYERDGPYKPCFAEGMFNEKMRPMFLAMYESQFQIMQRNIRSHLPDGDKYADKLSKWDGAKLMDKLIEVFKLNPESFNVLNHGDLWLNNQMFKYNEDGSLEDCIFLDFQLGFWGTPAYDLQYFILTSASEELRLNCWDYFVAYYHEQLLETLKRLNYNGKLPTLTELHIQILRCGPITLQMAFGILAIVLLESRDDASIENMMVDTEEARAFKKAMFSNPSYVRVMEKLLPHFDNRGFFEI